MRETKPSPALSPMENPKKQLWQEKHAKVARRTDRFGQGMDPRIIEVVVGLNMLTIPTSGSCEGHLDHGLANPWVDINLPEKPQPGETSDAQTLRLRTEIEALVDEFNTTRTDDQNEKLRVMDVKGIVGRIIAGPRELSGNVNEESATSLSSRQNTMNSFASFLRKKYLENPQ